MVSARAVNPHALADWGIASGRMALNGRERFLRAWDRDSVAATAKLLARPAQRECGPCPLFGGPDPRSSERVQRGNRTRTLRVGTAHEVASEVARAVAVSLGADPDDEVVADKIDVAVAAMAARQQKAIVKRRKATDRRRAKMTAETRSMVAAIERRWDDSNNSDEITAAHWATLAHEHLSLSNEGAEDFDPDDFARELLAEKTRAQIAAHAAAEAYESFSAALACSRRIKYIADDDDDY